MKIGKYCFKAFPVAVYTAYQNDDNSVYLLWCWSRINLTQDEFNGLLCFGKLERVE